jgi:hypothetical protein
MIVTLSNVMLPPGSTDSTAPLGMLSWLAPLIDRVPSESAVNRSVNTGNAPPASFGVQVAAVARLNPPEIRPNGSAPAAASDSSTTLLGLPFSTPPKMMLSVPPKGSLS